MIERLLANSIPEWCGYYWNGEPSECWLWIGNLDDEGYGRLTLRVNGKHKKIRAHRASFETFMQTQLAPGETLDHLCQMTRCIHPNHVEPASRSLNSWRSQQRNPRWPGRVADGATVRD